MKPSKLSLNDWIQDEEDQYKVTHICEDTIIASYDKGAVSLQPENVLPIILTNDHLILNGFKVSKVNKVYYIKDSEENLIYSLFYVPSIKTWFVTYKNAEELCFEIQYVHELQHLLRLTRLVDVADNFKIK